MVKYKINYEIKPNEYSKVIYGDSVVGDTPLLLSKDGKVYIESIESIFDENPKINYDCFKILDETFRSEKEYSLSDYKIWSDEGWVNIKKVIRHKCDKKIFKVLTHTGYVEVTEDHSLLTQDLKQLKPKDCVVNSTYLLNSYPESFPDSYTSISPERAFLYGFFYGDGSCGKYIYNSTVSYSWALNNSDYSLLIELADIISREYPNSLPVIYDTIKSSGVYKLCTSISKYLVDEYRNKFYDGKKYKKIPTEILNSNIEITESFFKGYWAADGCRKDYENIGCTRFDNKGQIGSAGLYFISKKIGFSVSVNTREDKEKIFRMTLTKKKQRKVNNIVKKISYTNSRNNYVYDIETDSGRFQAGIGDIIVKNTDSCMIELNTKALVKYKNLLSEYKDIVKITQEEQDIINEHKTKAIEEAFVHGKIVANQVTKALFKHPINLEFEKVYTNFLILSKKRYLGNYYGKDPYTIDMVEKKGIVLKRRDNPEIVKKIYTGVVTPLLEHGERGISISVSFLKKELEKLMNNDVNFDDLVVTKALAKGYGKLNKTGELVIGENDYKNTNLPHVALAIKMRDRDPGSAPNIGDRINYIFVELPGNPIAKLYEKAEDPKIANESGMKIDYLYYITNQIHNPVNEILKILMSDSEKIFSDATKDYEKKRQEEIKEAKIKSKIPKGQQSILKWIKPKE